MVEVCEETMCCVATCGYCFPNLFLCCVLSTVFACWLGSLFMLILGATCLGMENYDPCGGHSTGAGLMVAFGTLLCLVSMGGVKVKLGK